eukprot:TRINITY_DN5365_c0_g1_i1.p1 TRINITY_DN5365_c0_g1~~TRINITY_DN5365_c0_g1_i1.p1  ORF type:complete len:440 (+),score=116.27 TRINITY_DN5365_c0_g1_i1:50-1369(+)
MKKVAYLHETSPYVKDRLVHCFEQRKGEWDVIVPDVSAPPKKKKTGKKGKPQSTIPKEVCFQWDDYENIDWERVLKGDLFCNSYCFRKGLTRKVQLSKHIEHYNAKHPTSLLRQSSPQTWIIEVPSTTFEYGDGEQHDSEEEGDEGDDDYLIDMNIEEALIDVEQLFARIEEGEVHPYWILKPSLGNKGAEITVVNDYQTVFDTIKQWKDVCEWVLQQYIDRPLLVYGGKKFHMRVHVVAVGALQVFVHQDVICLITGVPYDREDITNRYAHITNSCVQREHSEFDENATVRLLSELEDDKEITRDQSKLIFEKIKTNVREIFRAVENQTGAFLVLKNCFELFGFDFLVDEQLNVWILEVNAGPDMKNTGDRLDHVVSSFLEDVLTVTVDKNFGEQYATYPAVSDDSETATILQEGRLHMVYNAKSPQWGTPNMSYIED